MALERQRTMTTLADPGTTLIMDTRNWRQQRDALLARVPLTDIVGKAPRCPHPKHPTNVGHRIELYPIEHIQRWACMICGAGGTAIDWISHASDLSPIDAFEHLRNLHEHHGISPGGFSTVRDSIEAYVDDCVNALWSNEGETGRDFLRQHGLLHQGTLERNRIGFDAGPHRINRTQGLPSNGPALVIPITSQPSQPIESVRVLSLQRDAGLHHWITPSWNIVGKTTRIGFFAPTTDNDKELLIVSDLIDALTAVTLRHPAIAVLSHGEMQLPTLTTIRNLAETHRLRICFPANSTDQRAAVTLQSLLDDVVINTLTLPEHTSSLNHWHRIRQLAQ
jgi:hypothetical protein